MTVIPRPGGRSARTKEAAFAATAALIAERGHEAITMTDIADRAGVAATSLYRRWGDVRILMMEVAVEQLTRKRPLPNTGSLRGDLRTWARRIAANLKSREGSTFFRTFIATAMPGDADGSARAAAFRPRVEQINEMLERARQRGEKVPSVDDVVNYLLAPIYVRVLFGSPTDESLAEQLADRLVD
jgi:AcrR family transcriptional regulator